MTTDPYIDPATGIFRNKLGITDPDKLSQAEADISRAAIQRLSVQPLLGDYDLPHLMKFHGEIFGKIYPWAGQVRTVGIHKPGATFAPPQYIEGYAEEVFRDLKSEGHLQGLKREEFVDRFIHYYAETNAIHPAREGNGRAQRAFLGQLAGEAGWPISWEQRIEK